MDLVTVGVIASACISPLVLTPTLWRILRHRTVDGYTTTSAAIAVVFYSGWGVFNKGPEDPKKQTVRWAVMELTADADGTVHPDVPKMPDKERERHDMAVEIYRNVQRGQWEQVFTWPDASTGERPRVVVVRQVLPP